MKHPIQPIENDKSGVLRFKENAIVSHMLEVGKKNGCGMNELACMDFSDDDRQQFAQLIGYSLSGYSELSYVDDEAYGVASILANDKKTSELRARLRYLEAELKAVRGALRKPMARLFGVHPDDLKRNG